MDTDKVMFKFFNEFIFLNHLEVGVDVNVKVLRKYIINRFHNIIPPTRILTTVSLINDIILKLYDKNLEGIQDDMYFVRENVMYMLSFEKFVYENPVCDESDDDNDDKNEWISIKKTNTNNALPTFQKTIKKSWL